MRSALALCATTLVLAGCALTHERVMSSPVPLADVGVARGDAAIVVDSSVPLSCTARWTSLAWCPADSAAMIGRPCGREGQLCGGACCEPAPAIICTGGAWVEASAPDCTGVDCAPASPCGTGACAPGRICVDPSSEIREPFRCVVSPFVAATCGEVPSEWLSTDPRSCELCSCQGTPSALAISLECACCDH